MQLLITTLIMIFISFNSFGKTEYKTMKFEELYCMRALMEGKILRQDDSKGFYLVADGDIYMFNLLVNGNKLVASNCRRVTG